LAELDKKQDDFGDEVGNMYVHSYKITTQLLSLKIKRKVKNTNLGACSRIQNKNLKIFL
jgi:hypothetical protein